MTRFYLFLLFLCPILFTLSCEQQPNQATTASIDKKAAPFDHFSFQRSFPDRDFDWRGWRKTVSTLRREFVKNQGKASFAENSGVDWTLQGPGNVAGRVNALAIKPGDENTVLAGFSGGGIFKTTDGGLNWAPVFDENLELAIGDVEYDPANPEVVYAGTGDPNMPSIVYNGNGVYKSTDGGETWNYLGLGQEGIISKIVIDPGQTSTVFAATMGNPYVRDNHRGIYKSTDGGSTWEQVLFVSNQAGASDLVMSPANPQILYASFWDRIRNNHESIIYGPNARVYKSTDGGETWQQLGGGLPSGVLGRTGLAISQQNPDKVYAIFMDSLSTPHGMYKTVDGGVTWSSVNVVALEDACGDFGWYFSKIRVDPKNDEDLYFLAIILWRKPPGNSGWQPAANSHADIHDLVFAPSGKRYLGSDGGVYRNPPGQMAWNKSNNLPTTQFYHTNFNPHEPDMYYGGAQDNGIRKGNGTLYNGWSSLISADGFRCMFDPSNPDVFWVETQNGEIHKTIDGGNSFAFGSPCLGTSDRCNWDTPYFLSKHNPARLFAGTYRVHFSDNGGGWGPISPDLTDGNIFGARFHTISCLDESPVLAEKLVAGTSDGNVWRREPTGNWTNITAGLPDRYVTSVTYSPSVVNRIYTTNSGFRDNEYIPHVHRSDNNGQSWTNISANLPNVPVNDLLVLPGHADSVIFVATDAGVYFTLSAGQKWQRLGKNIPFVPVFDLERNPVRNELMAATYARGIWTFPIDSVFSLPPAAGVVLTGTIATETGQGISPVQVCDQPLQFTVATGQFQLFSDAACLSAGIFPLRKDDPLNGVSTFDLVLINKHILGLEALSSPYKMIAADANNSRSITTFDIVALRRLILGIDTVFANTNSWRFIPADYTFPDPLNPFSTVFPEGKNFSPPAQIPAQPEVMDFIGLKVGDVNGNATPSATAAIESRWSGEWPVFVENQSFAAAETVGLVFSMEWGELAGVQFTISFDPDVLELDRVEPLYPGIDRQHFGLKPRGKNCITVSLENPELLQRIKPAKSGKRTDIFRAVFRTKQSGQLKNRIRLSQQPTYPVIFQENGPVYQPILHWHEEPKVVPTVSAFPNPFGNSGVRFEISAPQALDGSLRIYDNQGKCIVQQVVQGTCQIPSEVFMEAGIYWYEIRINHQRYSGKLVYLGT